MRALIRATSYIVVAQAITQLVGALAGFLLLRWLVVHQYAEYAFAFAFGSTFAQLIELGFTDSILGVIGGVVHQRAVGVLFETDRRAASQSRWCSIGSARRLVVHASHLRAPARRRPGRGGVLGRTCGAGVAAARVTRRNLCNARD